MGRGEKASLEPSIAIGHLVQYIVNLDNKM
jgi:hypothetical protein